MGRSVKKGPFVDPKLMAKVMKQKETQNREGIKTWARASTITPEMVGHTFMVHNGNKFLKVFVIEDMVGHKLGEFSSTRTFRGHTTKKAATPGAPAAPAGK
jgi:small subunit ribosomal protein S19